MSPSSRRAWIEIGQDDFEERFTQVALLTEGVDRNAVVALKGGVDVRSPSSRRAWIEITNTAVKTLLY